MSHRVLRRSLIVSRPLIWLSVVAAAYLSLAVACELGLHVSAHASALRTADLVRAIGILIVTATYAAVAATLFVDWRCRKPTAVIWGWTAALGSAGSTALLALGIVGLLLMATTSGEGLPGAEESGGFRSAWVTVPLWLPPLLTLWALTTATSITFGLDVSAGSGRAASRVLAWIGAAGIPVTILWALVATLFASPLR